MNPHVTVVMATCRLGGFDVVFPALKSQSVTDFDVVVVDYWYEQRRASLRKYLRELGFVNQVTHVPPKSYHPMPNGDAAYNTGFALARGALIVIISDYMHLAPGFIESHQAVLRAFEGRASLIGRSLKVPPPILKEAITPENSAISTFADGWRPLYHISGAAACGTEWRMRITDTIEGDFKFILPGSTPHELGFREVAWACFFVTQHNSLPRSVIHEVNGLDEVYDGAFGGADIDMGFRVVMSGHRFVTHPKVDITVEVDHHRFPVEINFPSGQPDTTRYENMLQERVLAITEGRLPIRAHNNWFDISRGLEALREYPDVMRALNDGFNE